MGSLTSPRLALVKELVRKQPCFSPLTEDEISQLCLLFKEEHVMPGETIVTEGDFVDSVFLIVSGTADVRNIRFSSNGNGKPQIQSVATLRPGDSIGLSETGFYSLSGKRTATVVANTEMVLFKLNVASFHGFALAHSHVNEVMRKYSVNIS